MVPGRRSRNSELRSLGGWGRWTSTVLSFSFDSEEVRSCETSRSQSLLPSTGASALSARDAVSLLSEMSLTPAARLAWEDGGD